MSTWQNLSLFLKRGKPVSNLKGSKKVGKDWFIPSSKCCEMKMSFSRPVQLSLATSPIPSTSLEKVTQWFGTRTAQWKHQSAWVQDPMRCNRGAHTWWNCRVAGLCTSTGHNSPARQEPDGLQTWSFIQHCISPKVLWLAAVFQCTCCMSSEGSGFWHRDTPQHIKSK